MIPKECKRLAEVDFPIAVVSKHSAMEKSIRHGHPSTLHLWWARRPLAACRAMLLGLLLPDPCDEHCPKDFKEKARNLLPVVQGQVGLNDKDLRKALLKFIGDFANWDLSTNQAYLEVSRGLVKAAHPAETPLVVDPFAGGGSIPVEALRLGCEAFASDLNPVACLILKVMLEDIPRHGSELANELRRVGAEIKAVAEKELAEFYPPDPDGSRPIAYLWARTVRCESPNCGAEIPLVRSFWLSKKIGRKRALRYKVIKPQGTHPQIEFEIFEPKNDKEVSNGTVTRAKATCPCCNIVLSPDRVRAQLREQRGGADVIFDKNANRTGGARLLAVVTIKSNGQGRYYRLPEDRDYEVVWKARKGLEKMAFKKLPNGLCPVPDELLPPNNTNSFRIPNYGMKQWSDISTARQKIALSALVTRVNQFHGDSNLKELLALTIGRSADFNASLNLWATEGEFVAHVFGRQALSMVWDFCETMPFSTESSGYNGAINWVARVVKALSPISKSMGQVQEADACESPLPDEAVTVWFTDPPYYDAVGYAELSDFFFVWLKRTLLDHPLLKDPYDLTNPLVPKQRECVQDENYLSVDGKPKNRTFFEKTIACAFAEGRRVIKDNGIGSVVFAHKTTEGWEALLSGMIKGGWTITGSWPIATERPGRLRSQESAALSTSVHLICRPRHKEAPVGDWSDVLKELPNRVGDWMERLQREHVRGADLVFACIGPALEIYSRYSKVVDAEEREIPLGGDPEASEPHKRGFLAYVWEVVGRMALEQVLGTEAAKARNGTAGAVEEDARLTALFLWTLQSTDGNGNNLIEKSPHPPFAKGGYSGEDSAKIRNVVKDLAKGQAEDGSRKSPTLEKGGEGGFSEDIESGEEDDEDASTKGKQKGFTLVFDVVRRFAQPLGIHLPEWEGRIIETKKGVVRLFSIAERAKQLFGDDSGQAGMTGIQAIADKLENSTEESLQLALFSGTQEGAVSQIKGRGRQRKSGVSFSEESLKEHRGATTLDRVHAAMLLQASGRANALRALLKAEVERSPDFLRLANALSALYPKGSEEKRLLDAMLLAVPR